MAGLRNCHQVANRLTAGRRSKATNGAACQLAVVLHDRAPEPTAAQNVLDGQAAVVAR
jgi:hypothetical protein